MPYRILRQESLQDGVRRIASEQVGRALSELADPRIDLQTTIYVVRRRCKKVRALLRLVRSGLGRTFRIENARFRSAGRLLSAARDAEASVRTYEDLTARYAPALESASVERLREALASRHQGRHDDRTDVYARLAAFEVALREARDAIPGWTIAGKDARIVREGLERSYGRGRVAFAGAEPAETDALHRWRRRVKDHRAHVRLLAGCWKTVLAPRAEGLRALSDLLGEDHDLAVLRTVLLDETGAVGTGPEVTLAVELIDARRASLAARIVPLGAFLYRRKPTALGRRLKDRWTWWHRGSARAARVGTVVRFHHRAAGYDPRSDRWSVR